jgi:hypothetical protein
MGVAHGITVYAYTYLDCVAQGGGFRPIGRRDMDSSINRKHTSIAKIYRGGAAAVTSPFTGVLSGFWANKPGKIIIMARVSLYGPMIRTCSCRGVLFYY